MTWKLLLLALAGALGTLARYGTAGWIHRINGAGFPVGTLTVNCAGCFLAGLLWSLFETRWPVSGEIRTIVLVGFMGAFTTFSTLILETHHLARSAEWTFAAVNLVLQNGLGMAFLMIGIALGRAA
jgi:CrcB protein